MALRVMINQPAAASRALGVPAEACAGRWQCGDWFRLISSLPRCNTDIRLHPRAERQSGAGAHKHHLSSARPRGRRDDDFGARLVSRSPEVQSVPLGSVKETDE